MRNKTIILFIFITIACNSSKIGGKYHYSQTGITCGFVDNKIKIELIDNQNNYNNIQGLATVIIDFDNLDTLSIDLVELQTIFIREDRKVLKPTDSEFIYFKNKLLPIIAKVKCWKCVDCNKETFSHRITYSFPFVINKK